LRDEKPNVRSAAATALGSMHAEHAVGNLEEALGDSEPSVVLAAANSLLLHDDKLRRRNFRDGRSGGPPLSSKLNEQTSGGQQQ
jgi:HEAT repeat protein